MANTLTGLIPVIYEAYDIIQRELVGFINHVYRNSSAERAALNQSVTYPVVPVATTGDITAGQLPPDDGDQTIGSDTMTISKSKYSPVRWNGEEQRSVGGIYTNVLRDQFVQSMRALVNLIEVDLATCAKEAASRAYGTAGATPFGTAADLSDFAQPRKILDVNGVPQSDLHMVVSHDSMANLRGKQSVLFKVNEAGTDAFLRRGIIGQVQQFDLGTSAGLTPHTPGSGASYQANGVNALGATALTVDTGTGTILKGDVITMANGTPADTHKYVVNTALTAGTVTIGKPGLKSAHIDNDAVALLAAYTPNIAFHRMAIHLVTRAPAMPVGPDGRPIDAADDVLEITDPLTGLTFQVALYRLYRRVRYEIGIAWGFKAVKSEFIATLLG